MENLNLIDLLMAVRGLVGHDNVTWDTTDDHGIIFHLGLTGLDKDGKVMVSDKGLELRPTDGTVAFMEMGN